MVKIIFSKGVSNQIACLQRVIAAHRMDTVIHGLRVYDHELMAVNERLSGTHETHESSELAYYEKHKSDLKQKRQALKAQLALYDHLTVKRNARLNPALRGSVARLGEVEKLSNSLRQSVLEIEDSIQDNKRIPSPPPLPSSPTTSEKRT